MHSQLIIYLWKGTMFSRQVKDRLIRNGLLLAALSSSMVLLLITVFLFKEGATLFWESPVEFGFAIVTHPELDVVELSASDLMEIKEGRARYWSVFGGPDRRIAWLSYDDLEDEDASLCELVAQTPGAVAAVFEEEVTDEVRPVHVPNISLTDFLFGRYWYPTAEPAGQFGILPLILGSLMVVSGAVVISVPLGVACAVYLAEVAHPKVREALKPVLEILAGIPSVVFGFFGLVVLVPLVQRLFDLPTGETALSGMIMLAIMALPTVVSVSEDAIKAVPGTYREASLALGASRWQTIYRVVVPAALSGINTAAMLGIGRAVGETMTVLMVTGNAAVIPHTFLQPVRTLTANIAAELGEAPQGGTHFKALFAIGCVLFTFSFIINMIADVVMRKYKQEER